MATHNKVKTEDFSEGAAYLELAKAYLKMGLWEDALTQYRNLAQHYESLGMKDKALEVMALMARIDPSKAGPEKEIISLKHPMKLERCEPENTGSEEAAIREGSIDEKGKDAYFDLAAKLGMAKSEGTRDYTGIETSEQAPGCAEIFKKVRAIKSANSMDANSNYNMGLACLELGFLDEAIAQFQVAYEKRENPFEAARLLGLCFKEKAMWTEAIQAFEKALTVCGIFQGDTLAAKCELTPISKDQGKMEEALELSRKNSTVEQSLRKAAAGANKSPKK